MFVRVGWSKVDLTVLRLLSMYDWGSSSARVTGLCSWPCLFNVFLTSLLVSEAILRTYDDAWFINSLGVVWGGAAWLILRGVLFRVEMQTGDALFSATCASRRCPATLPCLHPPQSREAWFTSAPWRRDGLARRLAPLSVSLLSGREFGVTLGAARSELVSFVGSALNSMLSSLGDSRMGKHLF